MADKDTKTEEATPKRQEQLRKEGNVAKSTDISTASVIGAALCGLLALGPHLIQSIRDFARFSFRVDIHHGTSDTGQLFESFILFDLIPLVGIMSLAAVVSGVIQTKGLFAMTSLKPQFQRINPIPNLKKVLPSLDTLKEGGKQVLKLVLVAIVVGNLLINDWWRLAAFPAMAVEASIAQISEIVAKLLLHAALAFAIISIVDLLMAKKKFSDDSKMTKQEVKDEHKQQEGDPMVKNKMRGRMRVAARNRKAANLETATVIVTNPTHFSVALRYNPGQDFAPVLLAKAKDEDALVLRARARKLRIPIVEHKPLARALYAQVAVLQPIPSDLYRAAAEVIGYVMRLRGGKAA